MFVSPLVVETNTIVNAVVTVTRFLNQVLEGQRETTESVSVICENMNTSCQRRHTLTSPVMCGENYDGQEKFQCPHSSSTVGTVHRVQYRIVCNNTFWPVTQTNTC